MVFPIANRLTPQQLLGLQKSPSRISPVLAQRQEGIDQFIAIPLFKNWDTPLRSLYRIYKYLCAGALELLGREAEYFFYRYKPAWALTVMPDPCDKYKVLYAILASLTEALVDAVNWRLRLGLRMDGSKDLTPSKESTLCLENVPGWLNKVPELEEPLCLLKPDRSSKFELNVSQAFSERNIKPMGYLYIYDKISNNLFF